MPGSANTLQHLILPANKNSQENDLKPEGFMGSEILVETSIKWIP